MDNLREILESEIVSFSVLTKVPAEILSSVLEKMRKNAKLNEHGKKVYVAKYKFEGAGDLTDSRNRKRNVIKNVFDDLLDTQAEAFTDRIYKKSNVISRYSLTKDSTVEITLSPDLLCKKLINNEEHSVLELDKFLKLETKFSKEFYRLFNQKRYSGKIVIDKKELFKALRVPKSYTDFNFIDKILNPSFEELEKYFEGLSFDNLEPSGTGEMPEVCEFSFKKYEKSNLKNAFKGKTKQEIEVFKVIMNS